MINNCYPRSQPDLGERTRVAVLQLQRALLAGILLAPRLAHGPKIKELPMKLDVKSVFASLLVLALALYPIATYANALTIRHVSDVGASGNADFWNLWGPTTTSALTTATTVSQE